MGAIPPLTGVAENMITDPWQTLLLFALIVIPAGNVRPTFMVIAFDKKGLPNMHGALEVSIHVTKSPFTGIYENTAEFVPAFVPLTIH